MAPRRPSPPGRGGGGITSMELNCQNAIGWPSKAMWIFMSRPTRVTVSDSASSFTFLECACVCVFFFCEQGDAGVGQARVNHNHLLIPPLFAIHMILEATPVLSRVTQNKASQPPRRRKRCSPWRGLLSKWLPACNYYCSQSRLTTDLASS